MREFRIWLSCFSLNFPKKVFTYNFLFSREVSAIILDIAFLILEKVFNTQYSGISTGNNPIYNLLPDILSKLSKQNLSNDSFCNIMQFLIASIKKVFISQYCNCGLYLF